MKKIKIIKTKDDKKEVTTKKSNLIIVNRENVKIFL